MTERRMNDVIGQSVIAMDSAEEIGAVKHFVVAPDVSRIERIHIDGRKKKAVFAEWDDLESFGVDRVMVSSSGEPHRSADERDIEAARGDIDLMTSRVLDTAGFEHGRVADVTFDSETGEIAMIHTDGNATITSDRIHSLGSYAVVVDHERR